MSYPLVHYTDPKELPGLKTQTIVKLDKPRDIEVDYEYKYDVTSHMLATLHGQTLVLGLTQKFQSVFLHTLVATFSIGINQHFTTRNAPLVCMSLSPGTFTSRTAVLRRTSPDATTRATSVRR